MKIREIIRTLALEEFKRQEKITVLKEQKNKIESIIKEMDDYDGSDIPDSWKEFDDFDFHSSAKDAAIADINADPESDDFQEIGDSDFEKGMDEKGFAEPIKLANMQLPNQEKEVDNIQKKLDFEKQFGKLNVNETKK